MDASGTRRDPKGRLFLLGRRTCLLEECLKLVGEKYQASPIQADIYFAAKLAETLFHVEELSEQLATGSDLGATEAGFLAEDFAEKRFCQLALDYFRLRLNLLSSWSFSDGVDLHPYDEDFVAREYDSMFPARQDGTGRTLEFQVPGPPSLRWFGASCFRILELGMQTLIDACVHAQLDFFEVENLGMGSDRVELYKKGIVEGSATEQEAFQFWMELASALLANASAIERSLLRERNLSLATRNSQLATRLTALNHESENSE